MWKRRSEEAVEQPPTPTAVKVAEMLGVAGRLLDVGAGRGRVSLPFALKGHELVAVEPDEGMAAGLQEDASEAGVDVQVVRDRWPSAAETVGVVDVALSAHVVYDVADIAPFLTALDSTAKAAVVLELSERHPWSNLSPLYRQVHGLERPDGPTATDLAKVVSETLGIEPSVERWSRPGQLWFENWDELCDFYGRRLVIPRAERSRLKALLAEHVTELPDRLTVGADERQLVTMWWKSTR